MKMQIGNIFSKKTLVYTVAATLLCVPVFSLQAQDGGKKNPPEVFVKYDKTYAQDLLIQVQFENKDKEYLDLMITDMDGNFLYSEKVSSEKFSKKFQVNPEYDKVKLYLSVIGRHGNTEKYLINNRVQSVHDVEVTKL